VIDAVMQRATDPWFWVMVSSALFAFTSVTSGLLIWAFKPTRVSPIACMGFFVALGIFVFRRWVQVITATDWPFDWVSATVTVLCGIGGFWLMVAIFRAIETDRSLLMESGRAS
jgi:hypothetical protein